LIAAVLVLSLIRLLGTSSSRTPAAPDNSAGSASVPSEATDSAGPAIRTIREDADRKQPGELRAQERQGGTSLETRVKGSDGNAVGMETPSPPAPPQPLLAAAAWAKAINLLPLIDPGQDAIRGDWTIQDGALCVGVTDYARLQIPYRPADEYDFRIVFTRRSGDNGVSQHLAGAGRSFEWSVGGWGNRITGFSMIQGRLSNENPTTTRLGITNGQKYVSVVQVRKDGVRAYVNDRLVVERKTDYSDMSKQPSLRLRDETRLGVGAWNSASVFHKIQVLEVSGKGTFTRPEDLAAKDAEGRKPPVAPAWRPLFDGESMAFLDRFVHPQWRLDDKTLVSVVPKGATLQSREDYGDGEFHVRFEIQGSSWLECAVRQGPGTGYAIGLGRQKLESLKGAPHDLVFRCAGETVTATLDGAEIAVGTRGPASKGRIQICTAEGTLRVLLIECRDVP
jgi:hypothetical protein